MSFANRCFLEMFKVKQKVDVKAVMFDLDGTLADSLEDIADSMNLVLDNSGFPTHGLDSYKDFVGAGMEALVSLALPEDARTDEVMASCLQKVRDEYEQRQTNKTKIYDGIAELLSALSERRLPLAILSNKPHGPALSVVKKILGHWDFAEILGAGADAPKKPDPSGALLLAERMGILPGEFIYLGDTGIDMETAKGAGMFAVGVLWGFRTARELLAAGAEELIDHPLDLLRLIK